MDSSTLSSNRGRNKASKKRNKQSNHKMLIQVFKNASNLEFVNSFSQVSINFLSADVKHSMITIIFKGKKNFINTYDKNANFTLNMQSINNSDELRRLNTNNNRIDKNINENNHFSNTKYYYNIIRLIDEEVLDITDSKKSLDIKYYNKTEKAWLNLSNFNNNSNSNNNNNAEFSLLIKLNTKDFSRLIKKMLFTKIKILKYQIKEIESSCIRIRRTKISDKLKLQTMPNLPYIAHEDKENQEISDMKEIITNSNIKLKCKALTINKSEYLNSQEFNSSYDSSDTMTNVNNYNLDTNNNPKSYYLDTENNFDHDNLCYQSNNYEDNNDFESNNSIRNKINIEVNDDYNQQKDNYYECVEYTNNSSKSNDSYSRNIINNKNKADDGNEETNTENKIIQVREFKNDINIDKADNNINTESDDASLVSYNNSNELNTQNKSNNNSNNLNEEEEEDDYNKLNNITQTEYIEEEYDNENKLSLNNENNDNNDNKNNNAIKINNNKDGDLNNNTLNNDNSVNNDEDLSINQAYAKSNANISNNNILNKISNINNIEIYQNNNNFYKIDEEDEEFYNDNNNLNSNRVIKSNDINNNDLKDKNYDSEGENDNYDDLKFNSSRNSQSLSYFQNESEVDMVFFFSNPLTKVFSNSFYDYQFEVEVIKSKMISQRNVVFEVQPLTVLNFKDYLIKGAKIIHLSVFCSYSYGTSIITNTNIKNDVSSKQLYFHFNFEDEIGNLVKIGFNEIEEIFDTEHNNLELLVIHTMFIQECESLFSKLNNLSPLVNIVYIYSDLTKRDDYSLKFIECFYEMIFLSKTVRFSFSHSMSFVDSYFDISMKEVCCCYHTHSDCCSWIKNTILYMNEVYEKNEINSGDSNKNLPFAFNSSSLYNINSAMSTIIDPHLMHTRTCKCPYVVSNTNNNMGDDYNNNDNDNNLFDNDENKIIILNEHFAHCETSNNYKFKYEKDKYALYDYKQKLQLCCCNINNGISNNNTAISEASPMTNSSHLSTTSRFTLDLSLENEEYPIIENNEENEEDTISILVNNENFIGNSEKFAENKVNIKAGMISFHNQIATIMNSLYTNNKRLINLIGEEGYGKKSTLYLLEAFLHERELIENFKIIDINDIVETESSKKLIINLFKIDLVNNDNLYYNNNNINSLTNTNNNNSNELDYTMLHTVDTSLLIIIQYFSSSFNTFKYNSLVAFVKNILNNTTKTKIIVATNSEVNTIKEILVKEKNDDSSKKEEDDKYLNGTSDKQDTYKTQEFEVIELKKQENYITALKLRALAYEYLPENLKNNIYKLAEDQLVTILEGVNSNITKLVEMLFLQDKLNTYTPLVSNIYSNLGSHLSGIGGIRDKKISNPFVVNNKTSLNTNSIIGSSQRPSIMQNNNTNINNPNTNNNLTPNNPINTNLANNFYTLENIIETFKQEKTKTKMSFTLETFDLYLAEYSLEHKINILNLLYILKFNDSGLFLTDIYILFEDLENAEVENNREFYLRLPMILERLCEEKLFIYKNKINKNDYCYLLLEEVKTKIENFVSEETKKHCLEKLVVLYSKKCRHFIDSILPDCSCSEFSAAQNYGFWYSLSFDDYYAYEGYSNNRVIEKDFKMFSVVYEKGVLMLIDEGMLIKMISNNNINLVNNNINSNITPVLNDNNINNEDNSNNNSYCNNSNNAMMLMNQGFLEAIEQLSVSYPTLLHLLNRDSQEIFKIVYKMKYFLEKLELDLAKARLLTLCIYLTPKNYINIKNMDNFMKESLEIFDDWGLIEGKIEVLFSKICFEVSFIDENDNNNNTDNIDNIENNIELIDKNCGELINLSDLLNQNIAGLTVKLNQLNEYLINFDNNNNDLEKSILNITNLTDVDVTDKNSIIYSLVNILLNINYNIITRARILYYLCYLMIKYNIVDSRIEQILDLNMKLLNDVLNNLNKVNSIDPSFSLSRTYLVLIKNKIDYIMIITLFSKISYLRLIGNNEQCLIIIEQLKTNIRKAKKTTLLTEVNNIAKGINNQLDYKSYYSIIYLNTQHLVNFKSNALLNSTIDFINNKLSKSNDDNNNNNNTNVSVLDKTGDKKLLGPSYINNNNINNITSLTNNVNNTTNLDNDNSNLDIKEKPTEVKPIVLFNNNINLEISSIISTVNALFNSSNDNNRLLTNKVLLNKDILNKDNFINSLNKGAKILILNSNCYYNKAIFSVEGVCGSNDDISIDIYEELLKNKKSNIEILILSFPNSRQLAETAVKYIDYVIYFKFSRETQYFISNNLVNEESLLFEFSKIFIFEELTVGLKLKNEQDVIRKDELFKISKGKFLSALQNKYCINLNDNEGPFMISYINTNNISSNNIKSSSIYTQSMLLKSVINMNKNNSSCNEIAFKDVSNYQSLNAQNSNSTNKITPNTNVNNPNSIFKDNSKDSNIGNSNSTADYFIGRKYLLFSCMHSLLSGFNINIYGNKSYGKTFLAKKVSEYLVARNNFVLGSNYIDMNEYSDYDSFKAELLLKLESTKKLNINSNNNNTNEKDNKKILFIFDNLVEFLLLIDNKPGRLSTRNKFKANIEYNNTNTLTNTNFNRLNQVTLNKFFWMLLSFYPNNYINQNNISFVFISEEKLVSDVCLINSYIKVPNFTLKESVCYFILNTNKKLLPNNIDAALNRKYIDNTVLFNNEYFSCLCKSEKLKHIKGNIPLLNILIKKYNELFDLNEMKLSDIVLNDEIATINNNNNNNTSHIYHNEDKNSHRLSKISYRNNSKQLSIKKRYSVRFHNNDVQKTNSDIKLFSKRSIDYSNNIFGTVNGILNSSIISNLKNNNNHLSRRSINNGNGYYNVSGFNSVNSINNNNINSNMNSNNNLNNSNYFNISTNINKNSNDTERVKSNIFKFNPAIENNNNPHLNNNYNKQVSPLILKKNNSFFMNNLIKKNSSNI